MSLFARVLNVLPLAGAILLASCGGGGGGTSPTNQQASPGIAVGEPNPGSAAPVVSQFVTRAQQADCADISNRVYVIDQKYAFMARTGRCGDASYAYELFGATPQLPLCSKADSIAGPRVSCTDDKLKSMFDTIVANLDKADLGLGSSHKVEAISFAPKDGTPVAFDTVATDAFSSIHTARKVVVKDAAAFSALWNEHTAGRSQAPSMPIVDFSKQMVIAAFAGDSSGCHEFGIRRLVVNGGKIVAEVEDRDINPVTMCVAVVTAPMQMIVVERSDIAVEFTKFTAERLPFVAVDGAGRTELTSSASRVIKDSASWNALWKSHNPTAPAPAIDFGKHMVVAVFLGARPNGCNSVAIEGIYRAAGKISVNVVEFVAGPGVMCTQAIVFPYAMVTLDRSDEPVEFWQQTRQLR